MKLITCYTESHRPFLKSFFGSIDQSDGLDVIIRQHNQECPTGEFAEKGWNDTTRRKFEFIGEVMDDCVDGETIIFSDVDVQFFKPLTEFAIKATAQVDIAFQNDYYGHACTGFFFLKVCKNTFDLVDNVVKYNKDYRDDQETMNKLLEADTSKKYKYGLLPPEFFTFGSFYKHWEGEKNFPIPDKIVMHHANWVKGIDKKIELLKTVRNIYDAKQA